MAFTHCRRVSDNIQSGASMVIYGGTGACAYTINKCGYGYLCPYTMIDTCVGFGAITSEFGTRPDERIVYSSFDYRMKALMNVIPCHQQ